MLFFVVYGKWEVDQDSLVVNFVWLDISENLGCSENKEENREEEQKGLQVDNVSNVFSILDYELILSMGMDLENDLKRVISLLLDFHLVNVDSVISVKLKKDILDLIRFDRS